MRQKDKNKALFLLNQASDILESNVDVDDDENQENIFCPLGEVISNVQDIEAE